MKASNLLLGALRPNELALLQPHLERRTFKRGDVLFDVGEDVTCISLPCGGSIAALVITMQDGRTVETATVGREGAIGGVVSQGYLPAYSRAVVQISGDFLRIPAAALQAAKKASPAIRNLFTRYSDCLLAQVLQSVACNGLHSIEARCARCLLSLQDRLGTDVLPVTHEQLAELLGVQRSYLTKTLKTMQAQGLIRATRGRVIICERADVEGAACECHGAIKRHYERVLGAVYGADGELLAIKPTRPPGIGSLHVF